MVATNWPAVRVVRAAGILVDSHDYLVKSRDHKPRDLVDAEAAVVGESFLAEPFFTSARLFVTARFFFDGRDFADRRGSFLTAVEAACVFSFVVGDSFARGAAGGLSAWLSM